MLHHGVLQAGSPKFGSQSGQSTVKDEELEGHKGHKMWLDAKGGYF